MGNTKSTSVKNMIENIGFIFLSVALDKTDIINRESTINNMDIIKKNIFHFHTNKYNWYDIKNTENKDFLINQMKDIGNKINKDINTVILLVHAHGFYSKESKNMGIYTVDKTPVFFSEFFNKQFFPHINNGIIFSNSCQTSLDNPTYNLTQYNFTNTLILVPAAPDYCGYSRGDIGGLLFAALVDVINDYKISDANILHTLLQIVKNIINHYRKTYLHLTKKHITEYKNITPKIYINKNFTKEFHKLLNEIIKISDLDNKDIYILDGYENLKNLEREKILHEIELNSNKMIIIKKNLKDIIHATIKDIIHATIKDIDNIDDIYDYIIWKVIDNYKNIDTLFKIDLYNIDIDASNIADIEKCINNIDNVLFINDIFIDIINFFMKGHKLFLLNSSKINILHEKFIKNPIPKKIETIGQLIIKKQYLGFDDIINNKKFKDLLFKNFKKYLLEKNGNFFDNIGNKYENEEDINDENILPFLETVNDNLKEIHNKVTDEYHNSDVFVEIKNLYKELESKIFTNTNFIIQDKFFDVETKCTDDNIKDDILATLIYYTINYCNMIKKKNTKTEKNVNIEKYLTEKKYIEKIENIIENYSDDINKYIYIQYKISINEKNIIDINKYYKKYIKYKNKYIVLKNKLSFQNI